jgi:hypothetical protein
MAGASDLVSYASEYYPQPAVQDKPIADSFCLKCHSDLFQKQYFSNHFHIFLPKWQSLDPKATICMSCHKDHDASGDGQIGSSTRTAPS